MQRQPIRAQNLGLHKDPYGNMNNPEPEKRGKFYKLLSDRMQNIPPKSHIPQGKDFCNHNKSYGAISTKPSLKPQASYPQNKSFDSNRKCPQNPKPTESFPKINPHNRPPLPPSATPKYNEFMDFINKKSTKALKSS